MYKRIVTLTLAAMALVSSLFAAEKKYNQPTAVIPYAHNKPTIDGVVDDAEWQGAFSQQALQTTKQQLSTRNARFWLMWDEENLYVAMRDQLRPQERLLQNLKGFDNDQDEVIHDDCFELWISMGATDPKTKLENVTTQFLGSFTGARFDGLLQLSTGKSRIYSYDTGWTPKSRITKDNTWEMELVIPRASLGATKGPFHDGMHFRALIARNYKRPWEQNTLAGSGAFVKVETHTEFVLSKTAPALHLLGIGDVAKGKIGPRLAAFGQSDAQIAWRYASDAVSKEGVAQLQKGRLAEVVNLPELDEPGDGNLRFTATDAAGAILLDWQAQRAFGPMPKDEIKDMPAGEDVAATPAPAPKTPAQLGITLGDPALVAEQTGHLWFPKIAALPGGGLQIVCSGQPDTHEANLDASLHTISTDQGRSWTPLSPWRYAGMTNWKAGDLLIGLPYDYASFDNEERTALRGLLVAVDASGKAVALEHGDVRISGFPRPLAAYRNDQALRGCLTTVCDGVVINDKRLLTLCCGKFAGDEEKHRTGGRSKDAYMGNSLIAIESLDGGRNWRYLTTVCDWTHWENDPNWVDRGRFEGPCESSLVELADGSLLAVYRTGMFEQNPLNQSISTDGGKTWSKPKPLPAFGVLPSLKKLANGGLLLATGRPGIWLWYSADGRGESWEPIDAMAHHNAVVEMKNPDWLITPTMQFNRFHTTSNVRILEIEPNKLLLAYDRIPFDWQPVPQDSPERNQIFVLPIEIRKRN